MNKFNQIENVKEVRNWEWRKPSRMGVNLSVYLGDYSKLQLFTENNPLILFSIFLLHFSWQYFIIPI